MTEKQFFDLNNDLYKLNKEELNIQSINDQLIKNKNILQSLDNDLTIPSIT